MAQHGGKTGSDSNYGIVIRNFMFMGLDRKISSEFHMDKINQKPRGSKIQNQISVPDFSKTTSQRIS